MRRFPEFSKVCGGCRCRAYATYGDYLAEDPACAYQPGAHGGRVIEIPETMTFGLTVGYDLAWEEAARARLERIPSFARGMVVKAVEAYARSRGQTVVTSSLLADVRDRQRARFRPRARAPWNPPPALAATRTESPPAPTSSTAWSIWSAASTWSITGWACRGSHRDLHGAKRRGVGTHQPDSASS